MKSWNFFQGSPRLSHLLEDKGLICDGDEISCWIFSGTDESGAQTLLKLLRVVTLILLRFDHFDWDFNQLENKDNWRVCM